MPLDALAANGVTVEALGAAKASAGLKTCLRSVAARVAALLPEAAQLPRVVKDSRLGIETAVIVALAQKLTSLLLRRDPLSERVHLTRGRLLATAGGAVAATLVRGISKRRAPPTVQGDVR